MIPQLTAEDVKKSNLQELRKLYTELSATTLPSGTFNGTALPVGVPRLLWKGKFFEGNRVWNRMFGTLMIEGSVRLEKDEIIIRYPQLLGLVDRLRPITYGMWLGKVEQSRGTIWFLLERVP